MVRKSLFFGSLTAVLFWTAGCAHTPPPVADMTNAKMALLNAENAKESRLAKSYYERATEHFEKARREMKAKNYEAAKYEAQKAIADARVAKIKATNEALQKQVDALRAEIRKLEKDFVTIEEGGEDHEAQ